jgi:hypothetical protein
MFLHCEHLCTDAGISAPAIALLIKRPRLLPVFCPTAGWG